MGTALKIAGAGCVCGPGVGTDTGAGGDQVCPGTGDQAPGSPMSQWPLSVLIRPERSNVLCRPRPEHQTDNTIIRPSPAGD